MYLYLSSIARTNIECGPSVSAMQYEAVSALNLLYGYDIGALSLLLLTLTTPLPQPLPSIGQLHLLKVKKLFLKVREQILLPRLLQ